MEAVSVGTPGPGAGAGAGAGSGAGPTEAGPAPGVALPSGARDVDADILPIVYDIIRSLERDAHDSSTKARDSHDCSVKVLELHAKLDKARTQIRRLPGIEFNKQEQLKQFEILRNQLQLKRELLQKYRNMCSFDTPFQ